MDQRADFVAVAQGHEVLTNLDVDPSWTTITQDAAVVDVGIFHASGVARRLLWLLDNGWVVTASPESTSIPVDGGRVLATGELLAVIGTDAGDVMLLELGSGDVVPGEIVRAHTGPVTAVAMGDGVRWASGGSDRVVKLWEPEQTVATIRLHQTADHLALSGEHLVTATGSVVQVWSSATAGLERTLSEGPAVRALTIMGGLVAVAGEDGLIRLWDVAGGRLVDAVPTAEVAALAAGETVLAAVDTTGTVTLWENVQGAASASGASSPRSTSTPPVPASLVVVPQGEDSPRLRADLAMRFDRDLEIRRVYAVPGPSPSEARLARWRSTVLKAGGSRWSRRAYSPRPRTISAGEAVRLVRWRSTTCRSCRTQETPDAMLGLVVSASTLRQRIRHSRCRSPEAVLASAQSVIFLDVTVREGIVLAATSGLDRLDVYADDRPVGSY